MLLSREELNDFMRTAFPQNPCTVESVGEEWVEVRYSVSEDSLRPGGTVSGPVMMLLADAALYSVILAHIGLVALAVTTSFNINFLRKPAAGQDLIARCRLMKLGKTLAVGEVWIASEGQDDPVAHATGTYSIPPKRG
ncbi:MAG: PaaI family thioesterase [Limnobacter sp.]|uniref:PaaI family thioesterase n=1 Tax=Limnobacter sp. TaxID=2003368 RepID=UPI00391C4C7F